MDKVIIESRGFLDNKGYVVEQDEQGIYVSNYQYDDYYRPATSVPNAIKLGLEDWLAYQLGAHWKAAKDNLGGLMDILKFDTFQREDVTSALDYLESISELENA
jgi:hypothetical protein